MLLLSPAHFRPAEVLCVELMGWLFVACGVESALIASVESALRVAIMMCVGEIKRTKKRLERSGSVQRREC